MTQHITTLFIILLVSVTLFKLYLTRRQISAIKKHYNEVPKAFNKEVTLEEHQTAGKYSIAKLMPEKWHLVYGTLITLWFTLGGGINLLNNIFDFTNYPLTSGVCVIVGLSIISAIFDLPFSYYMTFYVEQAFGFNKTTKTLFITDLIKSLILGLALGVPFLYLVLWLMQSIGASWWVWVWAVFVAFNLLLLILYPTFIAPMFNKFTLLDDAVLNERINKLLTECGFKSKGIYIMDGSRRSSHGNAYFTGIGSSKQIVFFDTLLKQLNHDEIIAVLAHELGHFKEKHITKQMISSFGITLVVLFGLSVLINQEWFYHALGVANITNANALILFFTIISLISLPFAPLMGYFSRKNEFEADDFAKKHSNKKDLINGLIKLYRDNANTLTPDDLYVKFHYSHPPASVRIANLDK